MIKTILPTADKNPVILPGLWAWALAVGAKFFLSMTTLLGEFGPDWIRKDWSYASKL